MCNATYKFALKDAVDLPVELAKASPERSCREAEKLGCRLVRSFPHLTSSPARSGSCAAAGASGLGVAVGHEASDLARAGRLAQSDAARGGASGAASAPPAAHAPTFSAATRGAAGAPRAQRCRRSLASAICMAFDLHERQHLGGGSQRAAGGESGARPAVARRSRGRASIWQAGEVALDTRINGKGSLTVNGEVTPQPAAASLTSSSPASI